MRPRTRTALAAAVLAVAAPVALAHASPDTGQTAHAKQSKASLLYVFEGQRAQMAPVEGQAGAYTFTMPIRTARQPVIWFTDRPARDAGTLSMRNFVGLWSASGTSTFATDPPNVAIAYTSGGKQKTFIATMTSPVIIPPTAMPGTAKLQATMTAVPEAQLATYAKGKGKLAKHAKKAQRNPLRFPASRVGVSAPSVFVDAANDTSDGCPAGYDRQTIDGGNGSFDFCESDNIEPHRCSIPPRLPKCGTPLSQPAPSASDRLLPENGPG